METPKPIKRNAAIVEFSKDHHFALLLVWKIREGLNKSIQATRISSYVLHYFETDLMLHFQEEEKLLFSKITADNQLRIQAESEHAAIYRMIAELKANGDDQQLLKTFADTLEQHIRFEERQLFNYLQENISESDLQLIASTLHTNARASESDWADSFWK